MISNMQQQNNTNGYNTIAVTVAHSDKSTVIDGPKINDNTIVLTNGTTNNIIKNGFRLNKDKTMFDVEKNNNNNDIINSNIINSVQSADKRNRFTFEQTNDTHHHQFEPLSPGNEVAHRAVGNSAAGQQNGDDKAPDHHARRPMNAFLIFCKRHRGIVREQYPNLENRAITKILGDWWASLSEEEKKCYTNLAKQYKDAFFTANPDFKWYKLPAPPLRASSTTTRPHSNDEYSPESDSHDDGVFNHKSPSSDNHVEIEMVSKPKIRKISKSNVGVFKLADEAQMGGLNSLMAAVETVSARSNCTNNEIHHNKNDTENHQSALQRELGETTSFFKRTIKMNGNNSDFYSPNSYQLNNDKSLSNIPNQNHVKCNGYDNVNSSEINYEFDDNEPKKTTRSCKGKRYLEFMHHKSNPIVKKNKVRTSSSSSSSSSSQLSLSPNGIQNMNGQMNFTQTQKMDIDLSDHLYAASKSNESTGAEGLPWAAHTPNASEVSKLFSADDFDLEDKIKTLPALNLDKYLSGKRTIKKKRKLSGRRHNVATNRKQSPNVADKTGTVDKLPKTIEDAKVRLNMVGSQKRKARKESITRRDIGIPCLVSKVIEPVVTTYSPVNKNPKFDNILSPMQSYDEMSKANLSNVPNNLFILATLAERAASIEV